MLKIIFLSIFVCFSLSGCAKPDANTNQNQKTAENFDATKLSTDTNIHGETSENVQPPKETTLSEYSTKILDKEKNRLNNIRIACEKLNGAVVEPNATFSFCNTVGPSTKKDGYLKADVLDSNGKKFKGLGGGKCQVSSTLYAAILQVPNITVTERHEHSKKVAYIEKGKDATVAYDYLDLKFINKTGKTITLYCSTDNATVKVEVRSE
ncbi:MAG: VanW family protein [Clostridia bacterium]|nr:VanW family protein [Clostridia bacterium]